MVKIQSDREHHIKKDQSQKCFVFQKFFPGGVFSVGRLASAHFRHGEAEHTAQRHTDGNHQKDNAVVIVQQEADQQYGNTVS